ncbi:MAG: hypothetical protein ABI605_10835 [Rhizobacter sp.]
MKHWAYHLVGLPWAPGAEGPQAFDCWGLVRFAVRLKLGIEMPVVQVGGEHNVAAIAQAAQAGGWRLVDAAPSEDDIVLMRSVAGRHVGFMASAAGRLLLLHSNGRLTAKGPCGGVMLQQLRDVACDGYGSFETWRRTP